MVHFWFNTILFLVSRVTCIRLRFPLLYSVPTTREVWSGSINTPRKYQTKCNRYILEKLVFGSWVMWVSLRAWYSSPMNQSSLEDFKLLSFICTNAAPGNRSISAPGPGPLPVSKPSLRQTSECLNRHKIQSSPAISLPRRANTKVLKYNFCISRRDFS